MQNKLLSVQRRQLGIVGTNIREMETMLESSLIEFILSDKPESKKPIAFADDFHITGSYKSILKRLPLIKMAFKSYGLLVNR